MKLFPMKCKSCGREFECDGHCVNINSMYEMEEFWNTPDNKKEQLWRTKNWKEPKYKVCTCDFCKNRLVDKHGKSCNNHCEPEIEKVSFT
jgi:hypothetical protein